MGKDSEENVSVWMASADVPSYAALIDDAHTDVCIVGAGIAGMTTAYLLAREGKSVVILDDGPEKISEGRQQRFTRFKQPIYDLPPRLRVRDRSVRPRRSTLGDVIPLRELRSKDLAERVSW